MENPFARRAVAEKARDDRVCIAHGERQRNACGKRELAADDRRSEYHAELLRRDVQRPAFAFAVAGASAHDLGEDPPGLRAAGEQVARAAMVREYQIVGAERLDDADRRGFLTDRRASARQLPRSGQRGVLLLECAHYHHRLEQGDGARFACRKTHVYPRYR